MQTQKVKELVPLGLLIGGLIYTTIIALTTNTVLTYQHWAAYLLIFVVVATWFFMRKISNLILGLAIILGLLNIIAFTPTIVTIGGGLTFTALNVVIAVQLFSLLVFITFLHVHWQTIRRWINKDGL